MEKWFVQNKKADFKEIGQKFQVNPVIARIIRNRDIIDLKEIELYLHPDIDRLYDPLLMKDMGLAVSLIQSKIKEGKKIRIISDYDVDGVISNYILYVGLKECGGNVDYEIPNRVTDGYGINENLIQLAYDAGIDTIITCDNGIAAIDQIAYAKELGMTVVVTDHHDIPFIEEEDGTRRHIASNADAVINPKQLECTYPFKNLCGAAVAYKFIQKLYEVFAIPKEKTIQLVEYAAIATVCDVVDLQGENRIFVKKGLELINNTKNLGIQALLEVNDLVGKKLSAYHLGFIIGPSINASGRLDTAKKALDLLLASNKEEALTCAQFLKSLNDERKDMTLKGVEEAIEQVETSTLKEDKVLVIYLPDCHESLAGIIAGRVREKYHKPVFVITRTLEGLKGSGRSIEAYNMFEEITKCKDLLGKFGGHPMAAGLSLEEDNLPVLRQKLNQITTLTWDDLVEKVLIDVPMPIDYATESFIQQLDYLEPFGKGNSKPLFAEKNWDIISGRILGKNQNVIKLKIKSQSGCIRDAMYFGNVEDFNHYICNKFGQDQVDRLYQGRENEIVLSCVYYPNINEYNGIRSIQAVIQYYM